MPSVCHIGVYHIGKDGTTHSTRNDSAHLINFYNGNVGLFAPIIKLSMSMQDTETPLLQLAYWPQRAYSGLLLKRF